jgi:seryl-tRNA synthetase
MRVHVHHYHHYQVSPQHLHLLQRIEAMSEDLKAAFAAAETSLHSAVAKISAYVQSLPQMVKDAVQAHSDGDSAALANFTADVQLEADALNGLLPAVPVAPVDHAADAAAAAAAAAQAAADAKSAADAAAAASASADVAASAVSAPAPLADPAL